MENRSVHVKLSGRDEIWIDLEIEDDKVKTSKVRAVGCMPLLEQVAQLRAQLKGSLTLKDLSLPAGLDHSSLLVREAILKLQGQWNLPYKDAELCHCRAVQTQEVIEAIFSGCHDVVSVRRKTSASSSCGTCKPDIEKLLKYCLAK